MSFAVLHIDHVEVFARDIAAAAHWYERVLGLKVDGGLDSEPVLIGVGGNYLALFKARLTGPDNSDDASQPPIRWRRVAWKTTATGFDEAQRHLAACGVTFHGPVDHGSSWSIYFADMDGNPLEITYDV